MSEHADIEFRVERSAFRRKYEIFGRDRETGALITNITFQQVEVGEYLTTPITLGETNAQLLMDELWRAGLRPTEGTGSAGALAATQHHLEDMRKIALDFVSQANMDNAVRRAKAK